MPVRSICRSVETQGIADDDQGRQRHGDGGYQWGDHAGKSQRHRDDIVADRESEILVDDLHRASRDLDR